MHNCTQIYVHAYVFEESDIVRAIVIYMYRQQQIPSFSYRCTCTCSNASISKCM